jgi:hypothetical protein
LGKGSHLIEDSSSRKLQIVGGFKGFSMVLFASAWSIGVVLPLGWVLLARFGALKHKLGIEQPPSPKWWLVTVALAALVFEVLGIWYEWPMVFFGSVWLLLALEGYWIVEELTASSALGGDELSGIKKYFYWWLGIGFVPVLLAMI